MKKQSKKIEIIPAILEKKFSKIKKLVDLSKDKVKTIQIDICDGKLTPDKTFASNGSESSFLKLKQINKKINLELDLIINLKKCSQNRDIKFFKSINVILPKRVVFHFSGIDDWKNIFQNLNSKIEIGLGIWLSDDVRKIKKLLEKHDFEYIQIMGIEKVGYGGQKLSSRVYSKIKYFHQEFPQLPIQIDGGVKVHNARKLKQAGVTRLVSGSGFFGADDLKKRVKNFLEV